MEPCILVALNTISTQQSKPTTFTTERLNRLIDFLWMYPNAKNRFQASRMILYIDLDTVYLVILGAKIRYTGHFYLSLDPSKMNGPIHTECKIIKNIDCSVAEAECAGIFNTCRLGITIQIILIGLGHQ